MRVTLGLQRQNPPILPFAVLFLLLLGGCASHDFPAVAQDRVAYAGEAGETSIARLAPVFIVDNASEPANRIGTPLARRNGAGEEEIAVTPDIATIYAEERPFRTERDSYTNLLYRIHFPEIPFSLFPFHLGWGNNIGLIVVVTLNSRGQPVLYTTVHTCGCYLAFAPTSLLAEDALPLHWNRQRQDVYGERLPGILDLNGSPSEETVALIFLRNATHRVREIRLASLSDVRQFNPVPARVSPLASLESLPLPGGTTTSFYETSGSREGYVKGSHKPWELLLMSWWALDWRIGEDKKLGAGKGEGPIFYTSLKPWAREASDLRDFPAFLRYWGWKL